MVYLCVGTCLHREGRKSDLQGADYEALDRDGEHLYEMRAFTVPI